MQAALATLTLGPEARELLFKLREVGHLFLVEFRLLAPTVLAHCRV